MKITCPTCEGDGGFWDSVLWKNDLYEGDCSHCDGTGFIGFKEWLHYRILMFLDWLLL